MTQEESPRTIKVDLGHELATTGGGHLLMDERGCHVLMPDQENLGVLDVTFIACTQSVFGYPNDEAQEGHPLARGLAYGVYEVFGSDWAQRLEQQNRVRFPDFRWAPKRHFLMLMHESMGEFLADDVRVELHPARSAPATMTASRTRCCSRCWRRTCPPCCPMARSIGPDVNLRPRKAARLERFRGRCPGAAVRTED